MLLCQAFTPPLFHSLTLQLPKVLARSQTKSSPSSQPTQPPNGQLIRLPKCARKRGGPAISESAQTPAERDLEAQAASFSLAQVAVIEETPEQSAVPTRRPYPLVMMHKSEAQGQK
ncbi:hypothetical protein SKAU_G00014090 [Synaphobranchus kaupii]|uniref:Uncharacterized protein n=1 Tax=Synaphobranchus kaupii TaxID=118154 RepID=A0A9Q1GBR6_SYNKA|nr:hypothetical protein SKAU_G00014090 [Synaphobranchus kaupii]